MASDQNGLRDRQRVNVVCIKWGNKYGPDYVNRLHRMVSMHLTLPHRFVCITEDPSGINSTVECLPMLDDSLEKQYNKISLFKPDIHGIQGKVLFLDLDVVITGSLDELFEFDAPLNIIAGYAKRNKETDYNSSVFLFRAGALPGIWHEFQKNRASLLEELPGDQAWITRATKSLGTPVTVWPSGWMVSFKKHCDSARQQRFGRIGRVLGLGLDNKPAKVPEGAKIVVFHGKPDPVDVVDGPWRERRRAPWIRTCWGE